MAVFLCVSSLTKKRTVLQYIEMYSCAFVEDVAEAGSLFFPR